MFSKNSKLLAILISVLVIGGVAWMVFSRFKPSVKPEGTIKIVTSFPMQEIAHGQTMIKGAKLALEEANYTVAGYKVELVVKDNGDENGAWVGEKEIAEKAAADPNVMAYIGPLNSGAAKISIPITNKAKMVQISINTWPGLTKPGFAPGEPGIFYPTGRRNYFRICATDDMQGPFAAIWAKDMGIKNVYIFDDGETFGKGVADLFNKKAVEIDLNVIGQKTIDKKATSFAKEVNEIKNISVDLVYFGGMAANGAVPLIKDMRKAGMKAKYMGPDGMMDQAFIDQAGELAEGTYLTFTVVPVEEVKGEKAKKFIEAYKARYNESPGTYSSSGYEETKMVLFAIEKAGVNDREKILEEVSKIKNYESMYGAWGFDSNGDTTLPLVSGHKVANKTFVFEKLLVSK